MSAEEIGSRLYELGCNFEFDPGAHLTTISVSGLDENLFEALGIVEKLIAEGQPDEDILANLKLDVLKSRVDAKASQQSCFSQLRQYLFYGPEFIKRSTLDNASISALTSEVLLAKVREIYGKGHEVLYYGPTPEAKVKEALLATHKVGENPEVLPERFTANVPTGKTEVILAPYESKQFYYVQYSDRGEKFDASQQAAIDLYNEYFGGGMNSIVFQEMREARGLAYSAYAYLDTPDNLENDYSFFAFIGSQNDKLAKAVEGFDEIINNMPESQPAFDIAKKGILSRIRTGRTTGMAVLRKYRECRRLGLDKPIDEEVFKALEGMTLDDVIATQKKWIADRSYVYAILGDEADLDKAFLKTLGPVRKVSLEEIFGY